MEDTLFDKLILLCVETADNIFNEFFICLVAVFGGMDVVKDLFDG